MPDVVVIGSGPNGLVAANALADAGWDVLVCEAEDEPGGAVRSAALTLPGFVHDRCSSFYPLAAASPAIAALHLEEQGLRWRRHPVAVAHPGADGSCPLVCGDLEQTAASVDAFARGDGAAFRDLLALWREIEAPILEALVTPFPPLRAGGALLRRLGRRSPAFARFGVAPLRRVCEERFAGDGAWRLLAGNAMHADLTPEQPGGGVYGLVLCGLAHSVGFPVAEGGAGALSAAMVRRLAARGGRVRCGARVERVLVRHGRAVGVRLAGGEEVRARRAVLADVDAPQLYLSLLERADVPARVLGAIERFQWGPATFKLDWALREPVPWTAEAARRAGTVHVVEGFAGLEEHARALTERRLPERPFLVAGQYARADPSRMPPGHEVLYAYTHVAQGLRWDRERTEQLVERTEAQVEAMAPGFRSLVLGRAVSAPPDLEALNANLRGGALNGGTAQLHQQLVLRPIPGLGRPETPLEGLYLASASAHPGGGVHGGCGAIAARAALRVPRPARRLLARAAGGAVPLGARAGDP